MPEGDTVFRTAQRLANVLVGHELLRFDVRVPGSATADLRGETVRDVTPHGKHLLHHIGDFTLHSHLRMEGEWQVYRRDARWRKPAYKARAILGTGEWTAVGFDLAMVEVLPTRDEQRIIAHLGPDPLRSGWDPAEAARRLAADGRSIHVALLDQRLVAGFGNEYANEMLFIRGIAPTRPAHDVDTLALVELGARMMRANRDRSRRTFTGDTRPGQTTWVFDRDGRPCRRCGAPIRRAALGTDPTRERNIFWCAHCQT